MAWIRDMARPALILATAAATLQRPRFRIGIVFRQPQLEDRPERAQCDDC